MVKIIILLALISNFVMSANFDENCISCHKNEFQFSMFIRKYTLKYSSEKKIKEAVIQYLKNPQHEKSVLPYGYLKRFGIKKKSMLSDNELKKMVDKFYEKYNMKDRIY